MIDRRTTRLRAVARQAGLTAGLTAGLALGLAACGGGADAPKHAISAAGAGSASRGHRTVPIGRAFALDAGVVPAGSHVAWSVRRSPPGSHAAVDAPDSARTTFFADLPGEYEFEAEIGDRSGRDPRTRRSAVTVAPGYDEVVIEGANATLLGTGDVDGDGRTDLVVRIDDPARPGDGSVWIYRQTSRGAYERRVLVSSPVRVFAVADLDGDGRADLVLDDPQSWAQTVVWLSNGDLTFRQTDTFRAGLWNRAIVLDVDQDGRPDLASDQGGMPLCNQGGGHFAACDPATVPLPHGAVMALADVDLDGHLDRLDASHRLFEDGWTLAIDYGAGAGAVHRSAVSVEPPLLPVGLPGLVGPTDLQVRDVDGDGVPELLFQAGGGGFQQLRAAAPGDFMPVSSAVYVTMEGLFTRFSDLDGDGGLFAATTGTAWTVQLRRADGRGGWSPMYYPLPVAVPVALPRSGMLATTRLEVADREADGRADLVVSTHGRLSLLRPR